jgi:hypothetical protein
VLFSFWRRCQIFARLPGDALLGDEPQALQGDVPLSEA